MEEHEEPLQLSRMATINKSSFWIFILACLVLYIANKITASNTPDMAVNMLIIGAAFTGLLLNILTITLTNKAITRVLTIICYLFEVISIGVLCFLVFSR